MRTKRFIALFIDIFIIAFLCQFIRFIFYIMGLRLMIAFNIALGWILLLCKDCYNGMSIGKRKTNIQVFDSRTMKVASPTKCVLRNCFLIFYLIEVLVTLCSTSGLRIGDYVVQTKVSERNTSPTKVNIHKFILTVSTVTIIFAILYIISYTNAHRLGPFRIWFLP